MSDIEETPAQTEPSSSTSLDNTHKDKITKPKAPGRVAAGKRLAEMNKKNKAKKISSSRSEVEDYTWDINPGYIIGGLALGVAVLSLYLQWRERSHVTPERSEVREIAPTPTEKKSKIPEME